jgi:hypothetical protein
LWESRRASLWIMGRGDTRSRRCGCSRLVVGGYAIGRRERKRERPSKSRRSPPSLLPVASPHINTPLANLACRHEIHSYPVCSHYNSRNLQFSDMATPDQQKQLQALSDEYTALQTGTSIGPTQFRTTGHLLMAIYRLAKHCCSQTKARISTTREQGCQECMSCSTLYLVVQTDLSDRNLRISTTMPTFTSSLALSC